MIDESYVLNNTLDKKGYSQFRKNSPEYAEAGDVAWKFKFKIDPSQTHRIYLEMFEKEAAYIDKKIKSDPLYTSILNSTNIKNATDQDINEFVNKFQLLFQKFPDDKGLKHYDRVLKYQEGEIKEFTPINSDSISIKNTKYSNVFNVEFNLKKGSHRIKVYVDKDYSSDEINQIVYTFKNILSNFPEEEIKALDKMNIFKEKETSWAGQVRPISNLRSLIGKEQTTVMEFPSSKRFRADGDHDMYRLFLHEMGHVFALKRAENFTPSGWRNAMRMDGNSISTYGNTNSSEDFAESVMMYLSMRLLHTKENLGFDPFARTPTENLVSKANQIKSSFTSRPLIAAYENNIPAANLARNVYYHRFRYLDNFFEKNPEGLKKLKRSVLLNRMLFRSMYGVFGGMAFGVLWWENR